jgi:hypothetical protein
MGTVAEMIPLCKKKKTSGRLLVSRGSSRGDDYFLEGVALAGLLEPVPVVSQVMLP